MSKASFKRALATATHVHVENRKYPELTGVREVVKVQSNAMALLLPVGHPRYDEVANGSWTYFDTADTADGDTYVHNDPMTGEVIARFTVVPAPSPSMFTVIGEISYDADTGTLTASRTTGEPVCIASNGAHGEPEVSLWDCPCRECTQMAYDAGDDAEPDYSLTLADYRRLWWPNDWK